jgi:SAM-dependent methyltransferase
VVKAARPGASSDNASVPEPSDLAAVKLGQQRTWSEGDFAMVATIHQGVSENLCEAVDVSPGERVLDVACGSGNTAIAAARRFTEVVGVDYVPALLDRGRQRAAAEQLQIEFREGDVEALPFPDAGFDVVLSTFGAMFAPDQPKAAAEVLRVCRPGGRIGMTNWTPDGFTGQMFKIVASHAPPPARIDPPPLWGTEDRLRELFGDELSSLRVEERQAIWRFRSPEHWVDYFRTYFGPTKVAFARVGHEGEQALVDDLLALIDRFNRAAPGEAMVCPSTFLEVVATRA